MNGQDAIPDYSMLDLFKIEAETNARALETGLVDVEQNHTPEAIEPLMRAAHSIKGAARIVGLTRGVSLAHAMEDVLSAAQQGKLRLTSDHISILLRANDFYLSLSQLETAEIPACLVEEEKTLDDLSGQLRFILEHPSETAVKGKKPAAVEKEIPVPQEAPAEQEAVDTSMLDLFKIEVETNAQALEAGLVDVEQNHTPEAIEPLMRAAHSIKGAARIVGLTRGISLAHAMEDVLSAAQQGKLRLTSDHITILLRANDFYLGLSRLETAEIPARLRQEEKNTDGLTVKIREILELPSNGAPAEKECSPDTPEITAGKARQFTDSTKLSRFCAEVKTSAQTLESGLVEYSTDPGAERLVPLIDAAHTIKGAARSAGLNYETALARAIEDMISLTHQERLRLTSEHIDAMIAGSRIFTGLLSLDAEAMSGWLMDRAESMKKNTQFLMDTLEAQVSETTLTDALHPVSAAPGRKDNAPKEENFVRVLSENLNRMLGIAGENLVQAKSAKPFFSSMVTIKNNQTDLIGALENLKESDLRPEARAMIGETLNRLEQTRDFIIQNIDDYENFLRRLEYLAEQLYNEVVSSRMRPFSDGLQGFSRLIRDLARKFGKKVNFVVNGESTRVDRDVLEKLKAPLTHLLQNAVDHGLETTEDRIALKKPVEGSIVLEARHASGMLNISLSDDGKGIDPELIRRKVVEKGLAAEDMAEHMSRDELYEFLFLPRFSTAGEVTEVSGRGVGLDVVFYMLREVGGSVRIESNLGTGTTFHLQLPLTLSVLRTLMVEINGEPYALPLNRIDRVISVLPKDLHTIEDRQYCTFENEHIGVISAQQVLQLPSSILPCTEVNIAIISDRLTRYGLVVDRVIDERELVVRPLDSRLGKIPNMSAGAIMENGLPVLIMDVDDLVRSIDNLLSRGKLSKVGGKKQTVSSAQKRILVVDDSLTVRQVERKILENNGYEVTLAVDGMDGWNVLQGEQFDLIISDVDMPRMNGIEFVRKIKSTPNLKDIPVMIISYKDREEDKMQGLEAGANYYLTKASFHDESLVNAVRDLIGEAGR